MGKKLFLTAFVLLVLGGLTAAVVVYMRLPKNAAEQLEWARKIERENNAEITKIKTSANKDQAAIDKLEDEIDDAYRLVVTKYPNDPEAEEADYKLIDRDALRGKLKGRALIEAYEGFMKKYPKSERIPDLVFKIAEVYDKDLDLKGEAILKYRQFIDEHPDHPRVPDALMEIGKIQQKIGEFEAAEKTYTELIDKFPDHPLAAEAQYQRGNIRADKLDKEEEALEDFKEAEQSLPADSAQRRVAGARREELGKKATAKSQREAQEEYYGASEGGFTAQAPPDDFLDPTVDIIREQGIDTQNYVASVELDPENAGLKGDLTVTVKNVGERSMSDTLILQFNGGMKIDELTQNGKKAKGQPKGNFLHIALAEPIKAGATADFHFVYSGKCDPSWKGDAIDEKGVYLRPESRWYPYTNWGDEFTVERIDVTVPEGWTAVGPGLQIKDAASSTTGFAFLGDDSAATPDGDGDGDGAPEAETAEASADDASAASTENGGDAEIAPVAKTKAANTFSWRSMEPIGLLAIVANEYVMEERELRPGLLLQCYTYPEHKDFMPLYMDELAEILTYYEELLGPFPFKKMAVAEIPFFPGGYGSPSLLMITDLVFKESNRVVAEFLAHEVAHQWFGNLLGLNLAGESHPWLSEGFATYVDALYIEKKHGRERFVERVRDMAGLYIESLIAFEDEAILDALWHSPMYRTLAYEKGGLVIHALRYTMDDEHFFEAMREYIRNHAHSVIDVPKFQAAMEKHYVYGDSLDWFFDQWLRSPGYPHYYLAKAEAVVKLVPGGAVEQPVVEPTPAAEGEAANAPEGAETEKPAEKRWITSVTLQQLSDEPFLGFIEVRVWGADEEAEVVNERVWLEEDEKVVEIETPFRPVRAAIDPDAHILKYPSVDDTEEDVKLVEKGAGE